MKDYLVATRNALKKIQSGLKLSVDNKADQFYDVEVDGITVVKRTKDPSKIDTVIHYIDDDTEHVLVRTFKGRGQEVKDRFPFKKDPNQLNGFGSTEESIRSQIVKEIQDELDSKKKDERIAELEKEVESLKNSRIAGIHLPTVFNEIGGVPALLSAVQGMVKGQNQQQLGSPHQQQIPPVLQHLGSFISRVQHNNERFNLTLKFFDDFTAMSEEDFEDFIESFYPDQKESNPNPNENEQENHFHSQEENT
ncbi:hypothetical protein [Bernardetia sp.]|uniref:hypothetical protein n=1 Tax=Bernardetia sp. TaxID=1937974 RepID=UPI0025C5D1DA|nr:hypothetical protein [Bernardetia sp.]